MIGLSLTIINSFHPTADAQPLTAILVLQLDAESHRSSSEVTSSICNKFADCFPPINDETHHYSKIFSNQLCERFRALNENNNGHQVNVRHYLVNMSMPCDFFVNHCKLNYILLHLPLLFSQNQDFITCMSVPSTTKIWEATKREQTSWIWKVCRRQIMPETTMHLKWKPEETNQKMNKNLWRTRGPD